MVDKYKIFFKIVEVGEEKYILDLTTVSPKAYFWGSLPDEITAKMQKLDKRDTRFDSVAPTMSKSDWGCNWYSNRGFWLSSSDEFF